MVVEWSGGVESVCGMKREILKKVWDLLVDAKNYRQPICIRPSEKSTNWS
jgi:hypothetical protein